MNQGLKDPLVFKKLTFPKLGTLEKTFIILLNINIL